MLCLSTNSLTRRSGGASFLELVLVDNPASLKDLHTHVHRLLPLLCFLARAVGAAFFPVIQELLRFGLTRKLQRVGPKHDGGSAQWVSEVNET